MSSVLASNTSALLQALVIHAKVLARDNIYLRPQFVCKAIAARLRTGVRALEAYLRRLLVVMALEMEHGLVCVHHPENMARKKNKPKRVRKYSLRIYPHDPKGMHVDLDHVFSHKCYAPKHASDVTRAPVTVPIGNWLDRLDHLQALAKNPEVKAKRLAFTLARSRHGILMAPDEPDRRMRRWGTEPSAIYDVLAFQIMTKSRLRPPPLPPPRRGPKPMITVFW